LGGTLTLHHGFYENKEQRQRKHLSKMFIAKTEQDRVLSNSRISIWRCIFQSCAATTNSVAGGNVFVSPLRFSST